LLSRGSLAIVVKDVEVALTLDLRDNAVLLEEICSAHF